MSIQKISHLIQPIQVQSKQEKSPLLIFLKELKCPEKKVEEIAKGIELASNETNINPYLLGVLLFTESGFDYRAKSYKGYVGLMQTSSASMKFADVDILHGARILQEKLKIADGNLLKALSLYKGGNNPVAKKQAKECLSLYRKVMGRG